MQESDEAVVVLQQELKGDKRPLFKQGCLKGVHYQGPYLCGAPLCLVMASTVHGIIPPAASLQVCKLNLWISRYWQVMD